MDKSRNTEIKEELKKSFDKHPRATKIIFAALVLALVLLLIWGLVSLVLLAFSVQEISVEGGSPYSSKDIIEACGIEKGDRLYYLSPQKKIEKMSKALPYIKSAEIKTYFPNKVIISAECYERMYVAEAEKGYVYLNEDFKVLEAAADYTMDSSRPTALNISEKITQGIGEVAEFSEKKDMQSIISAFSESGLEGKITEVFLKDRYDLALVLNGNIIVELGNSQNLLKKLALLSEVIKREGLGENDLAKVNVSDHKKGVFRPLDEEKFKKEIEFYKV